VLLVVMVWSGTGLQDLGVAEAAVCLLGFALAGGIGWLLVSLCSVRAGDVGVEVRMPWRRAHVPYDRILAVTWMWGLAVFVTVLPIVTLTVRMPGGEAARFRFMGRLRLRALRDGEPTDVILLRRRAGIQ
jgi:hypothetical protein